MSGKACAGGRALGGSGGMHLEEEDEEGEGGGREGTGRSGTQSRNLATSL